MSEIVSVKKYVWFCFWVSLIISVILGFIGFFLDVSVASFFIFLMACWYTGKKFIKDQERLPTKLEKRRLIWGAILIYSFLLLIVASILVLIIITSENSRETFLNGGKEIFDKEPLGLILLALVIFMAHILSSYLWALVGFSDFFHRKTLKNMEVKKV